MDYTAEAAHANVQLTIRKVRIFSDENDDNIEMVACDGNSSDCYKDELSKQIF